MLADRAASSRSACSPRRWRCIVSRRRARAAARSRRRHAGSGVGAGRQAHRRLLSRSHLDDGAGRPAGAALAVGGRLRRAGIEREPAWSPDGTRLAFAADRGDGFDIVVASVKSGDGVGRDRACRATSAGRRGRRTAASCSRIAPRRRRAARPIASLQWDLYLVAPVRGSDALAGAGAADDTADSETYPRVSPDGTRVVFVSDRDARRRRRPVVDAGAGGGVAKPVPLGARRPAGAPATDAGAAPIACAAPTRDRVRRAPTRVDARARRREPSPSWAPDNQRIAFYAVREGVGSVWVAAVEPPRARRRRGSASRAPKPAAPPQLVSRRAARRRGRPTAARCSSRACPIRSRSTTATRCATRPRRRRCSR